MEWHVEKLLRFLAWRLPRKLVMWCYVRVAAEATCGVYSGRTPQEVNIMEALDIWNPPISKAG